MIVIAISMDNCCTKSCKSWEIPHRIARITLFINQDDWKETNFSSEAKDWKKFETNNIQLLLVFVPTKQ